MLYVHIPYCRRKCLYCDFFSGGVKIADWEQLTKALLQELEERANELPSVVPSVYLGGGTPSLMPCEYLKSLTNGIKRIISNAGKELAEDCEITLEVNPEDATYPNINTWKEIGINRISLGIQTFNDTLLRSIGRSHSGEKAMQALDLLIRVFENVSADLIFGLPGQDEQMVRMDLERLVNSGLKHVSVYSLMYEEGTAMTILRERGKIMEVPEKTIEEEYFLITDILREAGFIHYEVSNYAIPGYQSRHNSGYWKKIPYLGIGPSAHSYDGGNIRRSNPLDIKGYLNRFSNGIDLVKRPFYTEEILDKEEQREESLMLSLRTNDGLDLEAYGKEYGEEEMKRVLGIACRLESEIIIDEMTARIRINEREMMRLDGIILSFM